MNVQPSLGIIALGIDAYIYAYIFQLIHILFLNSLIVLLRCNLHATKFTH